MPLVAASEFLTKLAESNCEENYFLVLAAQFLKITPLQVFRSFCLFLKCQRPIENPVQHLR